MFAINRVKRSKKGPGHRLRKSFVDAQGVSHDIWMDNCYRWISPDLGDRLDCKLESRKEFERQMDPAGRRPDWWQSRNCPKCPKEELPAKNEPVSFDKYFRSFEGSKSKAYSLRNNNLSEVAKRALQSPEANWEWLSETSRIRGQ